MKYPVDQANAVLDLVQDQGIAQVEIGGIKLTLEMENRHERLYALNLKGGLRYPQADVDRLLIERITCPGDVVVDGGANIGVTALEFIKAGAGVVHCFEPQETLFERLKTISSECLVAHKVALSDRKGISRLITSKAHNQGSTIDSRMLEEFPLVYGDNPEIGDVETDTIDNLFDGKRIDIIKLDVEGAELQSLHGAVNTISTGRVRAIYLESYRDIQQIREFLSSKFLFSYRVFLSVNEYKLSFKPIGNEGNENGFARISPTYLFMQEPLTETSTSLAGSRRGGVDRVGFNSIKNEGMAKGDKMVPLSPYKSLPNSSFWRRSVSDPDPLNVDPVTDVPFSISKDDAVATAGSCFAQHISRTLEQKGFNYLVTEDGSPKSNYRVFPARFGNLYTVKQLRQLFERAYGLSWPSLDTWVTGTGSIVDPFRPQIENDGFSTIEAMRTDRETHLGAVRRMFEECDVFIFTMGLTEGWVSDKDGFAVPLAPWVAGGPNDGETYRFVNFTVQDMVNDLKWFIQSMRVVNPGVRIILTVSPVPLIATYEKQHVLTSTVYSKSALRVVAEMVKNDMPEVAYFPSYEIITGPHLGYRFFEPDLRSISNEGVDHVMSIFSRHYLTAETARKRPDARTMTSARQPSDARELYEIICDEEAIEK
jgi:FkbM family methyltransferase